MERMKQTKNIFYNVKTHFQEVQINIRETGDVHIFNVQRRPFEGRLSRDTWHFESDDLIFSFIEVWEFKIIPMLSNCKRKQQTSENKLILLWNVKPETNRFRPRNVSKCKCHCFLFIYLSVIVTLSCSMFGILFSHGLIRRNKCCALWIENVNNLFEMKSNDS